MTVDLTYRNYYIWVEEDEDGFTPNWQSPAIPPCITHPIEPVPSVEAAIRLAKAWINTILTKQEQNPKDRPTQQAIKDGILAKKKSDRQRNALSSGKHSQVEDKPRCPRCNSAETTRDGKAIGYDRYKCLACDYKFHPLMKHLNHAQV